MIATLAAFMCMLSPEEGLVCPYTQEEVNPGVEASLFNGIEFHFCCPDCSEKFTKDPISPLKSDKLNKLASGVSYFDPVSRKRVVAGSKGGKVDYHGVRYYFENTANLKAFNASPVKYTAMPTKECTTCPVMNEEIKNIKTAIAYRDIKGVRYYLCCAGCIGPFDKEAAKYTAKVADLVKPVGVTTVK